MAKNIVVCSDGTGNTAIKGRGTNVFKLYEAVDLTGHRADPNLTPQVAFYDDGVGTENFKPIKIIAGMSGCGLSRNVKQLYKELVRIYDPGDRLYLFGFSRGAFTVRTLAGLIATCGILDASRIATTRDLHRAVARAYRVYRYRYRTALARALFGPPDGGRLEAFKKACCLDGDAPIRFMGVWDTVDAVGLPFHLSDILNTVVYRYKFPDYRLSPLVDRACHALAIDDGRHSFHPLLWDETQETNGRIAQVWFAGAHSNVGGGYPKQGMSLVSLDWMMAEAERAGLRFNVDERKAYSQHANVDDKLYDPRAGLGIFYRWKPRDAHAVCRANGVAPKVHVTVLERVAHGTDDYAPGNLPVGASLVFTSSSQPADDALRSTRTLALQEVVRQRYTQPLLSGVRRAVLVGRLSYYLYLATCTLVVIAAAGGSSLPALLDPGTLVVNVGRLIAGLVTSPLQTAIDIARVLFSNLRLTAWLSAGLIAAYVMSLIADRTMSAKFSGIWFALQRDLRVALKQARVRETGNRKRETGFGIQDSGLGTEDSGLGIGDSGLRIHASGSLRTPARLGRSLNPES
ncbi:MAG: DUF2235 domain-containing protein [Vicinamibacteraceae bacterium]